MSEEVWSPGELTRAVKILSGDLRALDHKLDKRVDQVLERIDDLSSRLVSEDRYAATTIIIGGPA